MKTQTVNVTEPTATAYEFAAVQGPPNTPQQVARLVKRDLTRRQVLAVLLVPWAAWEMIRKGE